MQTRSIQKTVYPIGYDKNAASVRGKEFTKSFNKWANYIRIANLEIAHKSEINQAFNQLMNY